MAQSAELAQNAFADLIDRRRDSILQRWSERTGHPRASSDTVATVLAVIVDGLRSGPSSMRADEAAPLRVPDESPPPSEWAQQCVSLGDALFEEAARAGISPTPWELQVVMSSVSQAVARSAEAELQGLRARLEQLEQVAHHTPGPLYLKDFEGRYLFVNEWMIRSVGRSRDQILGKTSRDLWDQPDAERIESVERRIASGGHSVTSEEIFVTSPEPHPVMMVRFPIIDRDGRPGLAGVGLDITERRRAEAEARHASELLELGDAFFEIDRDWRIVRVNRNLERTMGRDRSELLGRVVWDLWPEVATPGSIFRDEFEGVMREREPREFEAYFPPRDLWAAMTLYPIDRSGIAVYIRDTTLRKRSEADRKETIALLDTLLAAVPVGLAFVDANLRFVRMNEELARFTGVATSAAIGRTLREVRPDLAPQFEPLFWRVLATGEATLAVEKASGATGGDGDRGDWLVSHFPVKTSDGRPFMVGSLAMDITIQKENERRLAQARLFEQQLLGIVSHDLRTPLSTISLSAQALLRQRGQTREGTTTITRMLSAAERASRLVGDLLDLTQVRLGQGIPVSPRPMDLAQILHQVAHELRTTFPEGDLLVENEGDARGEWDPDRMAQAVSNLVMNALRQCAGRGPVTLRSKGMPDGVCCEVHSMGPPIPAEALPSLFEPLQPGPDPYPDSPHRRIGLGLFIARNIVEAHGGTIRVRSEEAVGTTFSVCLPRVAVARTR